MMRLRVVMLTVACGVAADLGGALHAQSVPTRTATLLWSVDGSESGDPFGYLRDYVLLKDGTTWALDFKDQSIRRYDAQGKALAVVGRKGSGPGEMRDANGLAIAPNGNVWVNDPANGRFSIFDASGTHQRALTVPIGGFGYRWGGWFDASGDLVELVYGREAGYRRINANGNVVGTIAAPNCHSGPTVGLTYRGETKGVRGTTGSYPFAMGGGIVADGRGHFWCAAATGTRVARLAYGKSDTIARTAREIPNIDVTRAERDEAIKAVETRLARYATNDFDASRVPSTKPGIAALYVDADGRLWVAHTPPYKQARTTFDVFSAAGALLFRVELPVRSNTYLPVVARGNEFVIASVDADDVVSLARYRLR